MKTVQLSELEGNLYSFLDSRVNTHFEHLELVFKEYKSSEIEAAANRLIECGLIYVVKILNDKPLYSTESKREQQTPYL